MKTRKIAVSICLIVICCSLSSPVVFAVEVKTEGFGDIVKDNGQTNLNGAMVWNGQEWVVNPTWEHKFFVDDATGERLKSNSTLDVTVSGLPSGETATHADGYGATIKPTV